MREVQQGERYEDDDHRQGTRVVRIVGINSLDNKVQYEVEVAERNPKTVGKRRWISPETLYRRYTLISRG
jgi:hypothetical protein